MTVRSLCGEDRYPAPLLAVAGHRLPGADRPFPTAVMDDDAWSELLDVAWTQRVTGLLSAAAADGVLPATAAQVRRAREVHRGILLRVLALEGELVSVAGILDGAGIPHRLLKGIAVARLDYADPSLRSFVDLDLLVRSQDIDRTAATMTSAGFERTLAEPRPGFDRRFDKGMTLIPAAGYELDLHRTFVLGPWGALMDPDQLWEDDGVPVTIGGREVRALSGVHRFVHAGYHAALGNWPLRLGSLRDVAEMLRWADADEPAAGIRRVAAAWRGETVVATAVADAVRLLGLTADGPLTRWATAFVPGRRDVRWLALHNNVDKTFAAQALATLGVLPRWRDRAAYVRALALPDRRYTADRHSSLLGRFRYAFDEVRRGSGRRTRL